MVRSEPENVRRSRRAFFRGTIAFIATFACVQLYAMSTAPRPSGLGPEPPQYAATDIAAPPPDHLTDWSFYLGGTSLSREDWKSLSERAIGIRGSVNDGDATWVDTVVALESPFFEVDDRLACAASYGTSIKSSCMVGFEIGIQRRSATEGLVAYSRGTPFVEDAAADAPPVDASACEVFLKCMAHSKLGGIVPIPKADWLEIVVYQLVGLTPMTDDLRSPENLRVGARMSEDYRRELERRVRDGEAELTAFLSAKMLGLQDKARYFLRRAAEFEEQDEK